MIDKQKINNFLTFNKKISSLYLYDLEILDKKLNTIKKSKVKNIDIFYCLKANPNNKILNHIVNNNAIKGIEFSSMGEMEKILKEKHSLKDDIFTGPGKTQQEIKFAIENQVYLIVAESFNELALINHISGILNKKQKILLRINLDTKLEDISIGIGNGNNKYGFHPSILNNFFPEIINFENLDIKGLHFFPYTNILDYTKMLLSISKILTFFKYIEKKHNFYFDIIDFGGGIGVDYSGNIEFNYSYFCLGIKKLLNKFKFEDRKIIFELGRYIVSDCGCFITRIIDIKESGRENKTIIASSGINSNLHIKSINFDYKYDILPFSDIFCYKNIPNYANLKINKNDYFDIYGPLCLPNDYFLLNQSGRNISVGDFIVFYNFGAYGKTFSLENFLSYPEIQEAFLPSLFSYKPLDINYIESEFDRISQYYDQSFLDWQYNLPEKISSILSKCTSKNSKIFDGCCGTGIVGEFLSKYGYKNIYGGDISSKMLKIAKSKNIYKGGLYKVDISSTSFENDFFNLTICISALNYINDLDKCLLELIRITKKNGYLIISFHSDVDGFKKIDTIIKKLKNKKILREIYNNSDTKGFKNPPFLEKDNLFRYYYLEVLSGGEDLK